MMIELSVLEKPTVDESIHRAITDVSDENYKKPLVVIKQEEMEIVCINTFLFISSCSQIVL